MPSHPTYRMLTHGNTRGLTADHDIKAFELAQRITLKRVSRSGTKPATTKLSIACTCCQPNTGAHPTSPGFCLSIGTYRTSRKETPNITRSHPRPAGIKGTQQCLLLQHPMPGQRQTPPACTTRSYTPCMIRRAARTPLPGDTSGTATKVTRTGIQSSQGSTAARNTAPFLGLCFHFLPHNLLGY